MPWALDVVLPDSRHGSCVRTCLVGVQICSRLEAAVLLRRMCCGGGRCRIPALRLPAPLTGDEPLQDGLQKLQSPVQYLHSLLQFQRAQQRWSFQEPICHCLEGFRELLFVTFVVAFCPPPLCVCLCSLPHHRGIPAAHSVFLAFWLSPCLIWWHLERLQSAALNHSWCRMLSCFIFAPKLPILLLFKLSSVHKYVQSSLSWKIFSKVC